MTIDHISSTLAEYDDLVSVLQSQIKVISSEHNFLRSEILKLLHENQHLQSEAGKAIKVSLEKELSSAASPLIISEMVQNLRKQLELSLKERSQLRELYEASQKQIETYQKRFFKVSNGRKEHDPTISILESKIESLSLELKIEKNTRENEETVKLKAQTEAAKLAVLLQNKSDIVDELKIKEEQLRKKLDILKQENSVLVATLECVTKSRNDLEFLVSDYVKKEKSLKENLEEAKGKVEEAVEIAEKAVIARDKAIEKEGLFQSEILRLAQYIEFASNDSNQKLTSQISQIHEEYNQKIKELKNELQEKNNELSLNCKELNKLAGQCKQLDISLGNLKLSDEQVNELTEEMIDKKSRLESNHRLLEETRRALGDVIQENEKLTQEIEALLQRENKLRSLVADLQTTVQYCQCKRLKVKLKKYKSAKLELEERVAKLLSLTEKWQNESEKLESLLQASMQNCAKLSEKYKNRNKNLLSKLKLAKIALHER